MEWLIIKYLCLAHCLQPSKQEKDKPITELFRPRRELSELNLAPNRSKPLNCYVMQSVGYQNYQEQITRTSTNTFSVRELSCQPACAALRWR